jgi:steroid delta-isomerase-like uncharacterized protein
VSTPDSGPRILRRSRGCRGQGGIDHTCGAAGLPLLAAAVVRARHRAGVVGLTQPRDVVAASASDAAASCRAAPDVLQDRILSEQWVDIPAAPGQPPGRDGAKPLLAQLTTKFPDFKVTIEEVLQDGNKVIVRSTITGTQRDTFMGFPAKHRKMTMQAVDIHEFQDGKIVRTWHTEDWLTGLQQLGVFEK